MAGADCQPKWTFGLVNSANKYLTAEKFQSTVNANGTSLKKKQIWTLERVSDNVIALKSCFNKYLSATKNGDLSAGGEEIAADQKFEFDTQPDGKVAIRSATHGRYVSGSGDQLSCYAQSVGADNLFTINLAMHPQVNLRNVNRKTYVHLEEGELRCNEEIPWGYDAMIIVEFHDGKYALRASNSKYLSRVGTLVDNVCPDALFTLVFRQAQVAFKDCGGKYLTAVGPTATMKSRKDTIGKDELFIFEDSHSQVSFVASNGKYVSTSDASGEVRAKHTGAVTDTEIFQMEAIDRTDRSGNVKWAFLAKNKKYWNNGGIFIADQDSLKPDITHFQVEWVDNMVALKASNGKYASVTSNGKMSANSTELNDTCKFSFSFVNRPILVLRGEFGFVGSKSGSGTLECNRSNYDVFTVVEKSGTFALKGASGKYWKVEGDGSVALTGDSPEYFKFELKAHTHMCIVAPNGQYIKGIQNGGFLANGGSTVANNTLWEY